MEVYSAKKPARQGITLAATGLLMAIAVLQSVSMVHQKRQRWSKVLTQTLSVDDRLTLKIPGGWRCEEAERGGGSWCQGTLDPGGREYELHVAALAAGQVDSAAAAFDHALRQMLNLDSPGTEQPVIPARLGEWPAALRGYQLGAVSGQRYFAAILVAVHETDGTAVLLLMTASGGEAETQELVRQLGAHARFGKMAVGGERPDAAPRSRGGRDDS